MEIYFLNSL